MEGNWKVSESKSVCARQLLLKNGLSRGILMGTIRMRSIYIYKNYNINKRRKRIPVEDTNNNDRQNLLLQFTQ